MIALYAPVIVYPDEGVRWGESGEVVAAYQDDDGSVYYAVQLDPVLMWGLTESEVQEA